MKRILLLVLLLVTVFFASCKKEVSYTIEVSELSLDHTTMSILMGETRTLVARVTPDNASYKDLTWSSNDATVATVTDAGKVTAVKVGVAIITVASKANSNKTATCTVTVTSEVVAVSEIRLDKTTLSIAPGSKKNLVATITPENATNTDVAWSSGDETIATVSVTGEVTAVKPGTAIITATSMSDKSKTATCAVTVPAVAAISLDNTSQANIPWQGGTYTVNVTSNGAWSARSTVNPGVSFTPNSGNVGVTSVVITVPQETTGIAKSALIEFTAALSGVTAIATWTGTQAGAETVTIAGTKWATRNLNAVAQGQTTGFTMATNPQDYGYLWKWGSVYAYDRTGGAIPSDHWGDGVTAAATYPTTESYGYDYANVSGITPASAGPAGDPCKALGAYRTPTQAQWKALIDAGKSAWATYQGVAGYFFGTKAGDCNDATIAENCIFISSAGYRDCADGSLQPTTNGFYWSSSVSNITSVYQCYFNSTGTTPWATSQRGVGSSVRCVQE